MSHPDDSSPVNPLPPFVWLLFAGVALPELAFSLGARGLVGGPQAIGWRLAALERYGFSGDVLNWMIDSGRWPLEQVQRLVTYAFVHPAFSATLFAAVMLLALGKLVAEAMGQGAVLAIFFGSAIFGAACYGLIAPGPAFLAGAFPSVYGLIGAYTHLLWHRLARGGGQPLQAFRLIALLMGFRLVWSVFVDFGMDWIAELAGFAFGYLASNLLAPGAMARVAARMRRD
ncbi:rhomboid family intramembrane serine protease [Sulfitobacter sp. LCG007]